MSTHHLDKTTIGLVVDLFLDEAIALQIAAELWQRAMDAHQLGVRTDTDFLGEYREDR